MGLFRKTALCLCLTKCGTSLHCRSEVPFNLSYWCVKGFLQLQSGCVLLLLLQSNNCEL